jgi:hypothetical protein
MGLGPPRDVATVDPGSETFKNAVQQGMTAYMRAKGVTTLTVDLEALTDKLLRAEWLVSPGEVEPPRTPMVGT